MHACMDESPNNPVCWGKIRKQVVSALPPSSPRCSTVSSNGKTRNILNSGVGDLKYNVVSPHFGVIDRIYIKTGDYVF